MNNVKAWILAAATGAASFGWAGQAAALDEITYGTNWVAQAEHGGFYQAVADGTYEKYGLKVTIIPKVDRAMLLSGKIDFYMGGNLLASFSAAQEGIPVLDVAQIFQKEPQIFMTHPEAGVKTFADIAKLPSIFVGDDLYVSGYQWMKSAYGFTDEQRKPYPYNLAGFLADKNSANQGYVTSEPFAVETEGGFKPDVFLMADAGYTSYSTSIQGMADWVAEHKDVTKRFVEASILGWYNYLYGDNAAANALIKADNPDMTDEQIAFSLQQMKDFGLVVSGDAEDKGIGCITDAKVEDFYKKMVEAKVLADGVDIKKTYTTEFVCQGLGKELVK